MSNIPPNSNESPLNHTSTDDENCDQTEQAVKALHQHFSKPMFVGGLLIAILLITFGAVFAAVLVFLMGSFIAAVFRHPPNSSNSNDDDAYFNAMMEEDANRNSLTNPSNLIGATHPDSPNNPININNHGRHPDY